MIFMSSSAVAPLMDAGVPCMSSAGAGAIAAQSPVGMRRSIILRHLQSKANGRSLSYGHRIGTKKARQR